MTLSFCDWCGIEIRADKSRRYCSRSCAGIAKTKGGIYIEPDGRARVRLRGNVMQLYSRCIMEAHLKRHLTYGEVVHHINGDPTDDRLENLTLVTRAEHAKLHHDVLRRPRKLTDEQVAEILDSDDSGAVLARRFGVSSAHICVLRREAGVPAPPPKPKMMCSNGHQYDEANTYYTPAGYRQCRACGRERKRRQLSALKAEVAAMGGPQPSGRVHGGQRAA